VLEIADHPEFPRGPSFPIDVPQAESPPEPQATSSSETHRRTLGSEYSVHFSWTEFQPDGTIHTLKRLLRYLGNLTNTQLYLSVGSSIDKILKVSSMPDESGKTAKSDEPIEKALREACSGTQVCRFATLNGHSSILLKQTIAHFEAPLAISFNLIPPNSKNDSGPSSASMLILVPSSKDLKTTTAYTKYIESLHSQLHPWLSLWWLAHTGIYWQNLQKRFVPTNICKRNSLVLAMMAFLILWIPLPYWPQRSCLLEPANKHFVASPLDGVLKTLIARPGEEVKKGCVLATLDDEHLRWNMASAQAELQSASKRRDSALVAKSAGELRLAQLEQEKQNLLIAAIQKQLQDLDLKSPVDGIVVQGNIDESNGLPVARGETIFEIASLDRMRLDIQLTTRDLATIQVGHAVTLRVDADHSHTWSAQITRIAPRAKVVDSKVVFIATAEIENPTRSLRPGMNGRVCISAGSKSIGWLLFSQPYEWLLSKLYW
jgi:hypothetical protein